MDDEIGCVVCSWVVNFKWIDGVKWYGYKGVFEIVVMVDYLFVFVVIIGVVKNYYFDMVEIVFIEDDVICDFIVDVNFVVLCEIVDCL